MNANFSLNPQEIHLWRAWLPDLAAMEIEYFQFLSPDEVTRANRFHFPMHRQRFILTRGLLRQILSLYVGIEASQIEFSYGPRGKPFLKLESENWQFNVSHSHDLAVFAVCRQDEIGVDVEKCEESFNEAVAKRFFHAREYDELMQLPEAKRHEGFYRLWSAKEAIIKAIGEGLYVELNEFFISLHPRIQSIAFSHAGKMFDFHVEHFAAHSGYSAAFAISQVIQKINYWQWQITGPELWVPTDENW
jgi:4'-phosphopantetheinyl transferase